MTTVLVTGVGSGVALSVVKALKEANRTFDRGYTVLGADCSWQAGALYVLDEGHLLPRCDDPEYIPHLIRICADSDVDYLIPGTDLELGILSKCRSKIEQEAGTHVIINPEITIETGFDKLETAKFLERSGFPYPETCLVDREAGQGIGLGFPYILKPRFGSGSVGLSIVRNANERDRHLDVFPEEMIAQQIIEGDEYTCGLSFGANGALLRTIVLQRTLKKGFTQFATVVDAPSVRRAIERIADKLPGLGAYNVQGRLDGDHFTVFEINPRFSGTTAFRAVAGQNEPDIYIQHHRGAPLPPLDATRYGLSMARYLNEFYFDSAAVDVLRSHGSIRRDEHAEGPLSELQDFYKGGGARNVVSQS